MNIDNRFICYIFSIIVTLASFCSEGSADPLKDELEIPKVLQSAKSLQYTDPLQAIQILTNSYKVLSGQSGDVFYDSQWLLAELYLKTSQYTNANNTVRQLGVRFANDKKYLPKNALLKAMLMLHNMDTEFFLATLAPFLTEYQDEQQPVLNTWYLYLSAAYQIRKYQFSKALPLLTQALEKAQEYKLKTVELNVRNQLVQLYYYTKQYERALGLSSEIISIASVLGDQFRIVSALSSNMNIYYARAVELANSLGSQDPQNDPEYQSNMKQSHELQRKVLFLAESIHDYRSMLRALIIQQSQRITSEEFELAVAIGKRVAQLAIQHDLAYENAIANNNLAIAYRQLNQFKESLTSLKIAENFYLKVNSIQSLMWIYEDYSLTYQMMNDFEKAHLYYRKYHEKSLALLNRTNDQTLVELQEKYAAFEKTQEIGRLTQQAALDSEQLRAEKMQRWLLITFLTGLFVIALMLFKKRQQLKQLLDKEAEFNQKVVELSKAKQRFFNNLSHEFRTALTLSIGPLKSFLSDNDLSNCEPIESALENNLHMMTLLSEVLDIEKMDANSLPMYISEFNFVQAIDSCLNRFQLQFKERRIQLTKKGFDKNTTLYFDPSHFEKIIANVLSNAGKYCSDNCSIQLVLIEKKHNIALEIRDNGPGIDRSELPYIFNRFYQGKSSADKCLPGTGIGLSMVKELIELHQGRVKITSQKSKGCCVKLSFKKGCKHYPSNMLNTYKSSEPDTTEAVSDSIESFNNDSLVNEEALVNEESIVNGEISADKNKLSNEEGATKSKQVVLIVDDNAKIRQLIRGILQPDYHVIEADNGRQALNMAESIQPDLLIVDVMMPQMDGYQLTEQLKSNVQLAHLSIILLTALSETEQRVRGLLLGADDYLAKPFDNDELKARVKNHLAQKQRISESLLKEFQQTIDKEPESSPFEDQESKRVKQLDAIIAQNLSTCEFDVEQMYTALNMTRSSLFRYTQKVYGCSPKNLMKKRRLELAYQMLTESKGTISEIAYAVGYQSLSAFSRAFREHFDYPPTKVKCAQPSAALLKNEPNLLSVSR